MGFFGLNKNQKQLETARNHIAKKQYDHARKVLKKVDDPEAGVLLDLISALEAQERKKKPWLLTLPRWILVTGFCGILTLCSVITNSQNNAQSVADRTATRSVVERATSQFVAERNATRTAQYTPSPKPTSTAVVTNTPVYTSTTKPTLTPTITMTSSNTPTPTMTPTETRTPTAVNTLAPSRTPTEVVIVTVAPTDPVNLDSPQITQLFRWLDSHRNVEAVRDLYVDAGNNGMPIVRAEVVVTTGTIDDQFADELLNQVIVLYRVQSADRVQIDLYMEDGTQSVNFFRTIFSTAWDETVMTVPYMIIRDNTYGYLCGDFSCPVIREFDQGDIVPLYSGEFPTGWMSGVIKGQDFYIRVDDIMRR
jgi:hypothetical protein